MKSAKAKKPVLPAIETNQQLHETVDEIARLEVLVRGREAKRDAAIQVVRIEHDNVIEADKARLASLMKLAATYAGANRSTLFMNKAKSAASALAEFGFRSGTPAIKPLNKKWNMEKILENLKLLKKYVRTVEEIDKQAIHDAKLSDVQLAELGIRIDSGESFFVKSKSEDADRLKTTAGETVED